MQNIQPISKGSAVGACVVGGRFSVPDAERQIKAHLEKALFDRYGAEPGKKILFRLEEEEEMLTRKNAWQDLMLAEAVADACKDGGYPFFFRGRAGASFACFLLGITDCNPLPPHFYCPVCKTTAFVDPETAPSGFDLMRSGAAKRTCPVCGTELLGDGHAISPESFLSDGEKTLPQWEIDVPAEALAPVSERVTELLAKEEGEQKTVRILPRRLLSKLALAERFTGISSASILPDETDVNRFAEEGLNGGFGAELFPDTLPVERIPATFSELIRLYDFVYNAEAKTMPKAHAVGTLLQKLRLFHFRRTYPTAYYAAALTCDVPEGTDLRLLVKGKAAIEKALRACGPDPGETRTVWQEALECAALDIVFLPAHAELSDAAVFLPNKGTIRLPMRFADRTAPTELRFRRVEGIFAEKEVDPSEQTVAEEAEIGFDLPAEGELCVVGGGPAVGKTTTLLRVALHLAVRQKKPVYLGCAAHSAAEIAEKLRILAKDFAVSDGIPPAPIRLCSEKTGLWELFWAAREEIRTGSLLIDDFWEIGDGADARSQISPYSEIRFRQAATAAALKEFAKQCRLPVVVTVPLSHDTLLRADHRPTHSDVRYHERIAEEADTVVLLHRDSCCEDGGDPTVRYYVAKGGRG